MTLVENIIANLELDFGSKVADGKSMFTFTGEEVDCLISALKRGESFNRTTTAFSNTLINFITVREDDLKEIEFLYSENQRLEKELGEK